ncbi:MAG: intradiol ring-cleavage dioxygenase [Casimicrobium sp.]
MSLSRRHALLGVASIATVPIATELFAQSQTPALSPTPRDTEGPFYPAEWIGDVDGDLVVVNGKRYDAGASMLLLGRIQGVDGQAIRDAKVEIWQVDATGRYRHPRDDSDGPLKRGFQGFGRVASDANGGYRFRTIKPVNYGGRPAHVHFRVEAKGYAPLTTQMYFAGENEERGGLGGFSRERARLTVRTNALRDADAKLGATFDIVLAKA